jgi:hypothetical protein
MECEANDENIEFYSSDCPHTPLSTYNLFDVVHQKIDHPFDEAVVYRVGTNNHFGLQGNIAAAFFAARVNRRIVRTFFDRRIDPECLKFALNREEGHW